MAKIVEASGKLNELNAKLEMQKRAVAERSATCEELLAEVEEGKSLSIMLHRLCNYAVKCVAFFSFFFVLLLFFIYWCSNEGGDGRDSSVSILTGYGLDGPGIESRLGVRFLHLPKPTLEPT
jgi:hypothetical protein